MKKTLIIMMAILLLMPMIFATDITPINQPMILWANFGVNASIVNIVNANATITNPNLVEVVTLQPMTADNPNTFYYNFTPNVSGTYLLSVQYGDSTGAFYTSTSTFYVAPFSSGQGEDMAGLSVIIALGIAIAVFAYLSFGWKTTDNGTTAVWKTLSMIILVLLLVVLAWASIDANNICALTYDSSSPTSYSAVCEQGSFNQGTTFLKLMIVVTIIFFVWISVALFISSINHLRSTGKL